MIGCEFGFIFVCILNIDLPKSAISVLRKKDGRFAKQVYAFVHAWYQMGSHLITALNLSYSIQNQKVTFFIENEKYW